MSHKPKPLTDVPKKVEVRVTSRQNIRCRFCGLTDGYRPNEEKCHYCQGKIFGIDNL